MVKVLVIHDVLYEAEEIERDLTNCMGECEITLCVDESKKEVMDIIEKSGKNFDLCFTMIKMQSVSGMQIAQKLRKENTRIKIVFIGDTDEYAMDAWRLGINAYLLKPITSEKLQKAIENI